MDESLNNQNNQQEPMPASEVEPAAPKLSLWQQLVKVFSDPVNFFNHLRSNPTWLFPFLLIVLMSIVFTAATKDQMLEYRKQLILDSDKMTEEMKDMALEQLENMTPTAYYIQSVVGSVIGSAIVFAIAAGLFLLTGNFFLGGKATFKQMFALYVWGNIVSLVEMPVKMILILQKNSAEVYTSLALLMDPQQSDTVLFKLLNAVDIFTIWKIILWSIGFGIIYRFSAKKSYLTVISLYVIYVLISVGLGRLFV